MKAVADRLLLAWAGSAIVVDGEEGEAGRTDAGIAGANGLRTVVRTTRIPSAENTIRTSADPDGTSSHLMLERAQTVRDFGARSGAFSGGNLKSIPDSTSRGAPAPPGVGVASEILTAANTGIGGGRSDPASATGGSAAITVVSAAGSGASFIPSSEVADSNAQSFLPELFAPFVGGMSIGLPQPGVAKEWPAIRTGTTAWLSSASGSGHSCL